VSAGCSLERALGLDARCEPDCPFWEPGGAVLDGRCAFERLDLARRAELAGALLRIRERLRDVRRQAEGDELHRLHRLLNASGEE